MRVVVQRSLNSSVTVDNKITGQIPLGLVLLVGFHQNDTENDLDYLLKKVLNLRIFDDEEGRMNRSILDIQGSILSISQFTLYGDCKKGNRPSYSKALMHEQAKILYEKWNQKLSQFVKVETGVFGADMQVSIQNDGPVTIILESRDQDD